MKEQGIRYLFGNPGTTELPVIDGCTVHPEVEYVMSLHEHIAMGMAMGYARVSGKPGVANVHVAPGLAHGLGNLYNAWRSRIPLVVTVGQLPTGLAVQEPILTADVVRMARPFTKWAHEVHHLEEWPLVLHRAFKEAMAPPQGPVLLSLPADVMLTPTDRKAPTITPVGGQVRPDQDEVERAARVLCEAEHPLIVAGDGVGASDAWTEMVALAERLGAPVYTEALGSLCNYPNRHSHWAGPAPTDPMRMRALFDEVDVVLLCGFTSQAPFAYFDGKGPLIPDGVRIVYIHDNPWEIGKNYPGVAGILGNVKLAVRELISRLDARGVDEARAAKRSQVLQAAFRRRVEEREARLRANPSQLSGEAVAAELASWLPRDGIVVNEAISNTRPFLEWVEFGDPLAFWGGKSGGLGHSMSAALGIKLGAPSRTVVNVVGDGTLLYYPQVLWTAAARQISVVFLILNNYGYSILKSGLRSMGGPWGAPDVLPPGLDIAGPEVNFPALARSFGVDGTTVRSRAELASALEEAGRRRGPYVIEAVLSPSS